jgi:hypothetical protein
MPEGNIAFGGPRCMVKNNIENNLKETEYWGCELYSSDSRQG